MGSGLYGDLRYCLNQANVNSEPNNTVVFDPSLAGTITLIQGPLPISKALEIDGPGQDVVTISGNHQSGVLNITGDSDAPMITISGLTIADGIGVQGAGGVFSDHATLSLSNCTVTGNSVPISGLGGGIYLNRGTLTVNSCTVSANVSGGDGGGIYNSGGTLIVNDSRVSDNTSGRTGGGIYSRQFFPFPDDTTFVLNSSVIAGNHAGNAAFDVGGLDISDAATITDSTISGNTGYQAGGISLLGTLARQTISTISGCAIVGNTASTLGAGIVNDGDSLTITRTGVSGNTSVREATGGIYNGGAGRLTLSDSIISDNVGGGMRNFSQLTISGSTISGNTLGGGLVTFFDTTRVDNSTFSGNSSNAGGGILVMPNAFAELTSVTITDNTANGPGRFDGGGGLSVLSTYGNGRALLRNTLVAGNFCAYAGPDVLGSVLSLGYNLVGAADDSEGWGATDLTGTSASPIDPRLGPLQDNGGPTPTHALLVGSPAINHGDPALIDSLDQRGSVRFHTGINPPVDIGAFDANFLQSFRLIAPSEVAAGEAFTITVTALDYSGNTASTFVGRVHFSSTDPDAALPDDYTFTAADAGTATFTVTLQTAGSQQLQVTALGPEGFHGNTTVIVDPAGDEANEPQAWASPVVNEAPRWSPSMPSPTPSLRGVFTAPTTPAVRAEIICPSHLHRRAPAVTRDMAAPIDLSPRTSEPDDCA
jgi:hypothetical protein